MTRIRPAFTPGSSNAPGLFAYGQVFDVVAPVVADGVWWYQPATGDVTDVDAFLWSAAEAQLAAGGVLAGAIVQGAWNLVPFDTPQALSIGTDYRFSAEASGQAAFDSADQGYPIASPDAAIDATSGAFAGGGGFPSSTWTGQHGIDLEYTADAGPAEGSAALGLELAVAATGARGSEGAAALGLDLAVASAGRRNSEGSADAGLVLALAAAGARPSRGVAAFVLNLVVAAAGPATVVVPGRLRASQTTAALGATSRAAALTATARTSTFTAT